jgi:hypothetical protein
MLGPNYNDFMLSMNDEHKNIYVSFLHNVSTKWWIFEHIGWTIWRDNDK